MASIQKPVDVSPKATDPVSIDDAWNWTVDQVVSALCDHNGPFLRSIDPISIPDPGFLEKALRENVIGGPALLTGLTYATLREELGIRPLGHRTTIMHLIRDLQRQSAKYNHHIQLDLTHPYSPGYLNEGISSVGQSPKFVNPQFGSPIQYVPRSGSTASGITQSSIIPSGYVQRSPHTPLSATKHWSYNQQQAPLLAQNGLLQGLGLLPSEQASVDSVQPNEGSSAITNVGNKDESVEGNNSDIQAESISNEDLVTTSRSVQLGSTALGSIRQGESSIIDERGKKRRRLDLTAVSTNQEPRTAKEPPTIIEEFAVTSKPVQEFENASVEQVEDSENITAEQCDSHPTEGELPTPDQDNSAAGQLVIDNQGRKRMKPILVTPRNQGKIDVTSEPPSVSSKFHKPGLRKPEDVYLGAGSLSVDRIFYGDSLIGQEIHNGLTYGDFWQLGGRAKESEFFIFFENPFGSGQRRYVGGRIKHYLSSSESRIFHHKGRGTILPYQSSLARKNYPVSATVFCKSSGGPIATRMNRSKWLGDDFDAFGGQPSNVNPFSVSNEASTEAGEVDTNWDYLEKWNHREGRDEILPIYGDSDSEGQYDSDTWREIIKEQGRSERPERSSGRVKRMKLSNEQVDEAIAIAMNQTIEHWKRVNEPKLRPKAWKIWITSKKENDKRTRIASLVKTMENLEDRLRRIVQEIKKDEWSTVKQLEKQCQSLQPSQFDLENCKWKLAVLKSKIAPEKPSPQARKPLKAQPALKNPEDAEGRVGGPESSDSDLDSFIVDEDSETAFSATSDESSLSISHVEAEGISRTTLDMDSPCSLEYNTPGYQNNEVKAEGMQVQAVAHEAGKTTRGTLLSQGQSTESVAKHLDIIDLTQMSESSDQESQKKMSDSSFAIRTPPLLPVYGEKHLKSDQERFKIPPRVSDSPPIFDLDSDSSDTEAKEDSMPSSQSGLPGFNEVDKIRQISVDLLVERKDRKRLLIWTVEHTPAYRRQEVVEYVDQTPFQDIQSLIWTGLRAFRSPTLSIDGLKKQDSDTLMRVAAWYVCWTIPVKVSNKAPGIKAAHITTTLADIKGFHVFYNFLGECLRYYGIDSNSPLALKPKKRTLFEDSGDPLQLTPNRKHRKYAIPESQETISLRLQTQKRVKERENRQLHLNRRLQAMGVNEADAQQVIVNIGKHDDQEFIFLNPKIGDRIQKHQIKGLQFMWREVVADHQGCLLAQTMGLGKTMQVIALLVTIAEAARSPSENVRNQVPENLRKSHTLILCPVALIENWWEEFLMWTPLPLTKNIGDLRKVTAALELQERISEIGAWKEAGGVMIIGFNTYRDLIQNKPPKSGINRLDDVQHEMVRSALVDMPSIIVADEAHAAKKRTSAINRTMNQLKSKSRIALTGSPLANNLEEYHSLIDWIAPNYLGTPLEFKANYEERIKEGLWQDSTPAQYRDSLKWLEVLKKELEPKVHRADISALEGRLEGKQEFVIRVPLTPLQEKVYKICVNSMASFVNKDDQKPPTVWALLSVLRLLCNHPKCFWDKLQARAVPDPKGKVNARPSKKKALQDDLFMADENDALVDASVSEIGMSQAMIDQQLAPFSDVTEPLESTSLSNKMLILESIVQFSREARDKILIFSHTLDTLNYIEDLLKKLRARYTRIDGKVKPTDRQQITKDFNERNIEVCIISTRAGGQGLNLYGANRVVIMDDHYNPMFEEQAVGRAYRIGQRKAVFVYHLMVGGTFEEVLHNQSVFKQQLAKRVVDNKNPARRALRGISEYLRPPQSLKQQDLGEFFEKDHLVLDRILAFQDQYV